MPKKGGQEVGCWREDQAYLLMSGTAWEVSGTFLATRKRKTVWARSTLMATVHFWPPAARDRQALRAGLCPCYGAPPPPLVPSVPSQLLPVLPAQALAPLPQASGTLGRKEVDEDGDRRDEYTGRNGVDDIEQGLALDEQVEDHLLVTRLLSRRRPVQ